MEHHLISVIVPVYNVEDYLAECIDSILCQTYNMIEIILIDDGATDSCPQILDNYAARDSRIKVIHQKNGGLSVARNAGIRIAAGEYITFVDSDDVLSPWYIEHLYMGIKETGAQIAVCDYQRDTEFPGEEPVRVKKIVYSNSQCLKNMYHPVQHGMEFLACAKLYCKTLFSQNDIWFPVGKLHEDMFTTYRLVYFANRVVFLDEALYGYRIRPNSIMTSQFDLRRASIFEATEQACAFFWERKERELLQYALNAHLRASAKLYCQIRNKYRGQDCKQVLQNLRIKSQDSLHLYEGKCNYPAKKRVFYRMFFRFPCGFFEKKLGI